MFITSVDNNGAVNVTVKSYNTTEEVELIIYNHSTVSYVGDFVEFQFVLL